MQGKHLDGDVRSRLKDVSQAADRAAALTRQLLAFSRRQVLQNKVVDLGELVEHLIPMLRRLLRENIELVYEPSCEFGYVRADANQLEQVIVNLVVNAQDAMPEGGHLRLDRTNASIDAATGQAMGGLEPGPYVLISVSDTGSGMDAETQARAFEPFFTTKKTGEGTGLGLSMAYGVVRQSGGHIQIESRIDEGTTFRIYLPRVEGVEPVKQPPKSAATPSGRETILVAEDETSVRELIAARLRSLGYRVLTATDGASAIETAGAYDGQIHLLLSDLVMPKMGGRKLAQEMRKTDAKIKVVFVSGYAGGGEGDELELAGAHFLAKPFSMQELAKAVRCALDGLPPEPRND
jgi:CheY-like chemotaxis protein